jgi:streptogramin lyase
MAVSAIATARAAATVTPLPAGYVEEFASPRLGKLAIGRDGSIWGPEWSGERVIRISANGLVTGRYLLPHGSEATEPLEAALPANMVLGGDGDMWFTERRPNFEGKALIGHISSTGQVKELVVPLAQETVTAIARADDGEIWFTGNHYGGESETTHAYIGRVDSAEHITQYLVPTGSGKNEPEPGSSDPVALALGADGNMWFLDDGHNFEQHPLYGWVTPQGVVNERPLPGKLQTPWESVYFSSMTLGADGAIWFPAGPESIGRVTRGGEVSEYFVTGLGYWEGLGDIAAGPDGNVWFTSGWSSLGRITPDGAITIFSNAIREFPGGLVLGTEGDLWYPSGSATITRFRPPFAPTADGVPDISGTPSAGGTLTVGQGSWLHEPTAFAYQWELCDAMGEGCAAIADGTGSSIPVTGSETGRTLRAVVTATNLGGSATATSLPSGIVTAPTVTPVPGPPQEPTPPPEVAATMTWKFGWGSRYTVVESLLVRGVPTSGEVELRCQGGGCPFGHRRISLAGVKRIKACPRHQRSCRRTSSTRHPGEIDLSGPLHGRHLAGRARVEVAIVHSGWIGKLFRFAVRRAGPPNVAIGCLAVGSRDVPREC